MNKVKIGALLMGLLLWGGLSAQAQIGGPHWLQNENRASDSCPHFGHFFMVRPPTSGIHRPAAAA